MQKSRKSKRRVLTTIYTFPKISMTVLQLKSLREAKISSRVLRLSQQIIPSKIYLFLKVKTDKRKLFFRSAKNIVCDRAMPL